MNRIRMGAALAGAWMVAGPLTAHAGSFDFLDGYYVPDSSMELQGPVIGSVDSDGGDGFGLRLSAMLGENVFLAGEYQSNNYDGFDGADLNTDLDETRIGLGYAGQAVPVYLQVQYVRSELQIPNDSATDSGYAAHLGFRHDLGELFTVEANVGYLDIGDAGSGLEYLVGAGIRLDQNFGIFADYRVTDLENDDDQSVKVSDIRAGLRFRF